MVLNRIKPSEETTNSTTGIQEAPARPTTKAAARTPTSQAVVPTAARSGELPGAPHTTGWVQIVMIGACHASSVPDA
jgi:hypothetical protein